MTGYIPTLEQIDELHRKIAPSKAAYELVHTHCVIVATIGCQIVRRQNALFPMGSMPADGVEGFEVRLSELRLERPRQWGACWLSCELWEQLGLDEFWGPRLAPSREGTPWLKVLRTLVAYRLIDPGSEWKLHRQQLADDPVDVCPRRRTRA